MTSPLTSTRPAWIRRSPSRREAIPASARNFCRRIPPGPSGVVSVVAPLALVVIFLGFFPIAAVVLVFFFERAGSVVGRPGRARHRGGNLRGVIGEQGARNIRPRRQGSELRNVREVLQGVQA